LSIRGNVRIGAAQADQLQRRAIADGELLIWTVYERPRDFPQSYIARPHTTLKTRGPLPEYLEGVRALLPQGLACLDRLAGDEAPILETWI